MKNQLKLCVLGASGRMGSTIISEALESNRVMLHSVSERKNHKWVGRDIGQILYGKNNNVFHLLIINSSIVHILATSETKSQPTCRSCIVQPTYLVELCNMQEATRVQYPRSS